jgi:hypothetical protein
MNEQKRVRSGPIALKLSWSKARFFDLFVIQSVSAVPDKSVLNEVFREEIDASESKWKSDSESKTDT